MITTFFLTPGLFIILIGAIVLYIGIRNKKKRKHYIKEGGKSTGVIIDNEKFFSKEKTFYHSIVSVNDLNHGELNLRMKIAITFPREIGSEIVIVYDKKNPKHAFEFTESISWTNTLFYVVGIMFIIGGLFWTAISIVFGYFISNLH